MFKGLLLAGALVAFAPIAAQATERYGTAFEMRDTLRDITRMECVAHARGWLKQAGITKQNTGPIMFESQENQLAAQCFGGALDVIDALVDEMFKGNPRPATPRESYCLRFFALSADPRQGSMVGRVFNCFHGAYGGPAQ